jgi:hypothetical protein
LKALRVIPLLLAACVTPQVYVTSLGPLRVVPDADIIIVDPATLEDGTEVEPVPVSGGLAVRTLTGRPVPFEARTAALEALEAHCVDQAVPGVPLYFGWRNAGDTALWTAAGCDPVPLPAPVAE